MKEIDFLPEWYKSGRQRQVSYRTQLIGLSGLLVIMIAWNFITTHSISKAEAQVEQKKAMQVLAESVSLEFAEIKSEVTEFQKKVKSMEELDSKIDVATVLAELSFLIGDNIVLSQVEFGAEKFVGKKSENDSKYTANVARVAVGSSVDREKMPLGDVRFKVVLRGIAAYASDIAVLICKLEESPYFCQVYPSFSKNRKMKAGTEQEFQVSEFELSCYLANYLEK